MGIYSARGMSVLARREGQYIISRAEYFPKLPDHSKCNNIILTILTIIKG